MSIEERERKAKRPRSLLFLSSPRESLISDRAGTSFSDGGLNETGGGNGGRVLSLSLLSLSGRKSGETEGKRAREEKEKENVERVF